MASWLSAGAIVIFRLTISAAVCVPQALEAHVTLTFTDRAYVLFLTLSTVLRSGGPSDVYQVSFLRGAHLLFCFVRGDAAILEVLASSRLFKATSTFWFATVPESSQN